MWNSRLFGPLVAIFVASVSMLPFDSLTAPVDAKGAPKVQAKSSNSSKKTASVHAKSRKKSTTARNRKKSTVAKSKSSKKSTVATSKKRSSLARSKKRSHIAKSKKKSHIAKASTTRYAYPAGIFMWSPPEQDLSPLPSSFSKGASRLFENGIAGSKYSPTQLVQAGVFTYQPLRGGIFKRREPVKYIVLHSTETERPADGPRVIRSWNHGMRHPGAQYVVDRDGVIYQTVDPSYATVHVNIFRTHNGVNNDNSIGIEIVRAGKQKYTRTQLDSVTKLVAYLQGKYGVSNSRIVGHGQIQPSNRTDPVNFNWEAFESSLSQLKLQATEWKRRTQS